MTARAFITGVSGFTLTANERSFLREAEPWGFILFNRNVRTPAQVTKLVAECREAVGTNAPVLIDQEGGRVQRLGHPHWPYYPSGATYGRIYDRDVAKGLAAAGLGARLIAQRSLAARHRRRLPADRGCSGARRQCRDRRPRLWPHAGSGGRDRRRGGGRAAGRRRAARAQAHARPWPRQCRQPRAAAGGQGPARGARTARFCGLSAAFAAADGDDRPCRFFRHRPARTGHDFSHNGA